jgi:hypothetical protein
MNAGRIPVALTSVGVVVAIAASAPLYDRPAAAQSVPDVVRARAIELVDARGRVRAQLNVESTGEVVLRLRDSTGTIRVKLGASDDGSGLLLANEATEPGVHILASWRETSLTLQRGERRHVITPER